MGATTVTDGAAAASGTAARTVASAALGLGLLLMTACGAPAGDASGPAAGPPDDAAAAAGCSSEPASGPRDLAGLTSTDVLYTEVAQGWERVIVYRDGRVAILDAARWAESTGDVAESVDGEPPSDASADLVVVPVWMFPPDPVEPVVQVGRLPGCAVEGIEAIAATLEGASPTGLVSWAVTVAGEDGLVEIPLEAGATVAPEITELKSLVRENLGPTVEVAPDALTIMGPTDMCLEERDAGEIAAVIESWRAGGDDVPDARALVPGMTGCLDVETGPSA